MKAMLSGPIAPDRCYESAIQGNKFEVDWPGKCTYTSLFEVQESALTLRCAAYSPVRNAVSCRMPAALSCICHGNMQYSNAAGNGYTASELYILLHYPVSCRLIFN